MPKDIVQKVSTKMPGMLRLPGVAKKIAFKLLGKPFAGSKKSKTSTEVNQVINQQYTSRVR